MRNTSVMRSLPAPVTEPDTWTAAEVATYLRLSARQVRNLAAAGQLPGVKFGTDWRFHRPTIIALMKGEAHADHA